MSLEPGFLVIDKAPGATSHDIVAMVRAVTGVRKVGHTGTLDPFAKGVLPLALGSATRLIQFVDESEKVYDATITLGSATDTGDPTGQVVREEPVPPLTPEQVQEVLAGFLGERLQEPPRFSAVKVQGRRLYEYARAGQDVKAAPRPIRIHALEMVSLSERELRVMLTCSRGTYARGLADEVANALGTAGHLSSLTRVRSGPFDLARALPMTTLSEVVAGDPDWERCLQSRRGEERVPWKPRIEVVEALEQRKIPLVDVFPQLPVVQVSRAVADVMGRGGPVPPPPAGVRPGGRFLVLSGGHPVALGESRGGGRTHAVWRSNPPGER